MYSKRIQWKLLVVENS